jgi:hypothetical protein
MEWGLGMGLALVMGLEQVPGSDLAHVVSVAADSRLIIPLVIREIHRESLLFSSCHSSFFIGQPSDSVKLSATTLLDGFAAGYNRISSPVYYSE